MRQSHTCNRLSVYSNLRCPRRMLSWRQCSPKPAGFQRPRISTRKSSNSARHKQIAWDRLGQLLAAQNKLDRAVECFEKALALRPDLASAKANLEHAKRLQTARQPEVERQPPMKGTGISAGAFFTKRSQQNPSRPAAMNRRHTDKAAPPFRGVRSLQFDYLSTETRTSLRRLRSRRNLRRSLRTT